METGRKKRNQPEVLEIPSWDLSATGQWGIDTGLHALRDDSASDLVRPLYEGETYHTAIMELVGHGHPRKAAEVARAIIDAHPETEEIMRSGLDSLAEQLLDAPLDLLPASPSDYKIPVRVKKVN